MRVTTAFNKMLAIVGASVAGVTFGREEIVVLLRRRRGRYRCPCGQKTWSVYDRRVRRWRHLDLGATRCHLEAEVVRVRCRRCRRVRTEEVPWARPGARHTKDFQDVVCLARPAGGQDDDHQAPAGLLGGRGQDGRRRRGGLGRRAPLDELYRIGVDEVSYRKGHRYLDPGRRPRPTRRRPLGG